MEIFICFVIFEKYTLFFIFLCVYSFLGRRHRVGAIQGCDTYHHGRPAGTDRKECRYGRDSERILQICSALAPGIAQSSDQCIPDREASNGIRSRMDGCNRHFHRQAAVCVTSHRVSFCSEYLYQICSLS